MGWFDEAVKHVRSEVGKIGDQIGVTGNAVIDLPAMFFRGIGIGGTPSVPNVAPPELPFETKETIRKQEEAMRKEGAKRGRASTILGGLNAANEGSNTSARRMLLGE